jgi:SAM-dependent methyltransferase
MTVTGGGYDEYPFVADLYEHDPLHRGRPDVGFFVEAARASGSPVLEIGCGTGRILIPTARAGIEVVGLDLSPHMLAVCRARLLGEPDEVRTRAHVVDADMRRFDLGIKCLGEIRRHLVDDGVLILDIFNPSLDALTGPIGLELGNEPEFSAPDGRRIACRYRVVARDRHQQVNQIELIYCVTYRDGRRERLVHAFSMRYLFRFEAEHLLVRAGFEVAHLYADYDRTPYGAKYPGELLFVARKTRV